MKYYILNLIKEIRLIINKLDVTDLFQIIGLGFIWHGLSLYVPWVAYTVVGIILLVFGSAKK